MSVTTRVCWIPSVPYGEVVLDDAGRPAVFASACMGIAPMAGMLSRLVTAGSDLSIILLHAYVHERTFALRRQVVSDILALRSSIHLWYEEGAQTYEPVTGCHTGMMDLSQVDLPVDATYYLAVPCRSCRPCAAH